ncbi:DUF3152 domain-containing protein [uncultured Bifidobacterium sp.]|uniref:DUF3152 domain-containing protein n=1 Tax=uncultured Bifidobacterium sp. TaxID=165187 RepID=UPI0026098767|nr:DUF3152 domain-containing protein [uncultured Bifidobacterium sp.]
MHIHQGNGRIPSSRGGRSSGRRGRRRVAGVICAAVVVVLVVGVAASLSLRVISRARASSTTTTSSGSTSLGSVSASTSAPASSSGTTDDQEYPATLTDSQRSTILARARSVAKSSGKTLHEYKYCVATKGDVGDVESFISIVFRTLNDPRGWPRAGAVFTQASTRCDMTIYLSEAQYMTQFASGCSENYSCRVGDEVIINLTRWNHGVDSWLDNGGTLARYRRMVIDHEVGHRLGHKDNETTCDAAGNRAPLMQEQSMNLRTCIPNEWPLDDELWISN